MKSLSDTVWRNASYDGVIEFRIKLAGLGAESSHVRRREDVPSHEIELMATEMRLALERAGFHKVRIEHVRFPG